jgi:O-antigen ligase
VQISRKFCGDAFILAVLFLATGAFQSLVVDNSNPQAGADGSPLMKVLWAAVYFVVALRVISQYHRIMQVVRANKFLLSLVFFAILSTVWSEDPALTLRRGVAVLATTALGIDFAIRYPIREQLRLLGAVLGLTVLLSILAQVLFPGAIPTVDTLADADAWYGVFNQKNQFARIVVLATLVALTRTRQSRRQSVVLGLLVAAAIALVIAAKSMGGLVILVALILLVEVFPALRWKPRARTALALASVLVVIPVLYLAAQNIDSVTAMLGRDSTLTGRVKIWPLALSSIANRPFLGYGYEAFWYISPDAIRINEMVGWDTPHSHNGYIDLTLSLGLLGLALYLAGCVVAMRRAVAFLRADGERESMWPLAYLSFTLLNQLSESSIFSSNSILWLLYIAAACSVARVASADVNPSTPFAPESNTIAPDPDLIAIKDYV